MTTNKVELSLLNRLEDLGLANNIHILDKTYSSNERPDLNMIAAKLANNDRVVMEYHHSSVQKKLEQIVKYLIDQTSLSSNIINHVKLLGYNSPDNQNFKIVDMDQVLKKKVMNPGSTD